MKAPTPLLLAAALAGCAGAPFGAAMPLDVQEAGRSQYCNSAAEEATATVLADPQAVLDWQAARGITLAPAESLAAVPYVLVEMGTRPTGGYGIAVARAAELRGETVTLQATFIGPAPGAILTQALSSPCVLVRLPAGRYATVEVRDETGTVRARGGVPTAPPPPASTPAA